MKKFFEGVKSYIKENDHSLNENDLKIVVSIRYSE